MLLLGIPQEVAKKRTKGPNAPWNPRARKVVSLSLHSFFREGGIFSFCVCKLKKLANMEITRNKLKQMSLLSATHPSPTEFQTKTFSLPSPAARGGKAARDALDQTCLSPISLCSAAQERFPKAAAFGSLSWFVLSRTRKNEHQNSTANACRRHRVSVKRRSRRKFS